MVTSQGLINEGQRWLWSLEEKPVAITTDEAVEGSDFIRGEALNVPGSNFCGLLRGRDQL